MNPEERGDPLFCGKCGKEALDGIRIIDAQGYHVAMLCEDCSELYTALDCFRWNVTLEYIDAVAGGLEIGS